ncbi:glycosyltransferase family 4 protein [Candidatus Margulisiibacteriota bacterium]
MRIGIDARCLQQGLGGGTARVFYSLLKEWNKTGQANEYVLYFSDLNSSLFDLSDLGPNFQLCNVRSRSNVGLIWQQIALPLQLLRDKIDMFYSPYYSIPLFYLGRKCVVVHDISYHTLREEYPKKEILSDIISRLSCLLATKVITDSEASKMEIMEHYHISSNKISVVPCGIDKPANMTGESSVADVVKGQYALYVGTMFNRRHVVELIKAWDVRLAKDKSTRLVLVGKNATRPRADLDKMISEINQRHGGQYIIYHKFVNDDELNTLYSACAVFIYLSTYEGFGLPPLEAMLHDKPVIVGNAAVFHEIIGKAALIIEPKEQEQILEAVDSILSDTKLCNELISRGRQVVDKLKWARSAKLYLERFDEVI